LKTCLNLDGEQAKGESYDNIVQISMMYCKATSGMDLFCCDHLKDTGKQIDKLKPRSLMQRHHPGSQVVKKNSSLASKTVPLSVPIVLNTGVESSSKTLRVPTLPQTMDNVYLNLSVINEQLLHSFRYQQLRVSRMYTIRILTTGDSQFSFGPYRQAKEQSA
jgi:hypothetical protein